MRGDLHDEEFKASVVKFWNDGYSAGYIADKLGSTRNVILGMIHRLKDGRVAMRNGTVETVYRKPRDRTKKSEPSMPEIPEMRSELIEHNPKEMIYTTTTEGRWVSLYDLKKGHCRYIEDSKFCNAEGFPWCDEHAKVVVQKKW